TKIDPVLAEIIKNTASEGKLPCAVAFKIAEDAGATPAEVGVALALLDIKISKCRMGIFGYGKNKKFIKSMENVPPSMEKAIRENIRDAKITCRDAWNIAERLGTGKMEVASACERLGIKVSSCQLGAF
ncbi:MAG: hypothetical protein JW944_04375, partial [Deltaproteobacteria bacterium]|nr:hypothetical protein [Deltaproteobacteria bacterium]